MSRRKIKRKGKISIKISSKISKYKKISRKILKRSSKISRNKRIVIIVKHPRGGKIETKCGKNITENSWDLTEN